MSKLIVIKFIDHCSLPGFNIYKPGDVAGFSPEDARLMLEGTKVERNGKSVKVGPWAKKVSETSTEEVNKKARKVAEAEKLERAKAEAKQAQEKLAEAGGTVETKEEKKAPKGDEKKPSKDADKKSE